LAIKYLDAKRIRGIGYTSSTGSAANLTMNGDPTVVTSPTPPTGLGTQSLHFDGTGDYYNGSLPVNSVGQPYSFSFWFRSSVGNGTPVSFGSNSSGNAVLLYYQGGSGSGSSQLRLGRWGGDILTSSVTINVDTWYHIVLTYDGSTVKLYVNNNVDSYTGTLSPNGDAFYISGIAGAQLWTGEIDSFGFWNKVLSSTEVGELYGNGGSTAKNANLVAESNLIAYYGCDSTTQTNEAISDKATLVTAADDWTTQTEGTLSVAVDAANNELDYTTGFSTSQLGAASYDLQSVLGSGNNASNSTWVLRFKINPTAAAEDNNLLMMISKTQNAMTTTSTDRLGFLLYGSGTYWNVNDMGGWYLDGTQFYTDGAAWGGSIYGNTSTLTRNADPIYVTITRTSTTGATMSISPNSDYTTSAYSIATTGSTSLPSGVQDLRYITFQSASHATSSNRFTGTISDIKFWNATTSTSGTPTKTFSFINSNPNLTNGTLFEESDTGKHYMFDGTDTWNEIT